MPTLISMHVKHNSMKFNPLPWLCILLLLSVGFWARRHLMEEDQLAFFCEAGGVSLACKTHWLLAKVFYESYAVGYLSLLLGGLALLARSSVLGQCAALIGSAGLVLNNAEYAAVGFLLGVLVLARTQLEQYRAKQGVS